MSEELSFYAEKVDITGNRMLRPLSYNGKPPPENQPSLLLSPTENENVFNLLDEGCKTLSTAVVQLLMSSPEECKWEKEGTGVACFVRDPVQKSYFVQVICLQSCEVIFSQELYRQFEFRTPHPFLVTFEAENAMVGLNFADMVEASNFRRALSQNLEKKRRKAGARKSALMKIQESRKLEADDAEEISPADVTTKVQNMVIGSTNNQNRAETKIKDLGYAMFCKRMEQIE